MVNFPDQSHSIPIVLLHGFCESNVIFDSLLPELSSRYQVLTPNLPGHGTEPLGKDLNDTFALADWLFQELRPKITGPFVLVGHSLGGYIAAAFASRYPQQLKGLMMLHSTAFGDSPEKYEQRLKAVRFIEQHGPDKFYPQFLNSLFPKGNAEALDILAPIVRSTAAATIAHYSLLMASRPTLVEDLHHLNFPVHYFAGMEDAFIPLERIQSEQQQLPQANWDLIPNIGHMGMYEAPEQLLQSILCLMEKVET